MSDKILSIGQGGHIDIMAKAYTYFRLYHLDLPEMLSRRGVTDRNVLPDYYWRDDSLKIWNALSKYATSVLTQHYQGSDLHVRRDQHVQNLIRDMKFNGYWNEDPDYQLEGLRAVHRSDVGPQPVLGRGGLPGLPQDGDDGLGVPAQGH